MAIFNWGSVTNTQEYIAEENANLVRVDPVESKVYARTIHPIFTVTDLPVEVKYFQIVRCKRDADNRTVLDAGLVGGLFQTENTAKVGFSNKLSLYVTDPSGTNNDYYRDHLEYVTPEINFYPSTIVPGQRLDIQCLVNVEQNLITGFPTPASTNSAAFISKVRNFFYSNTYKHNISISQEAVHNFSENTDAFTRIGDINVYNLVRNHRTGSDNRRYSYRGTTLLLRLGASAPKDLGNVNTYAPYCYRRRITYPFGGNSYFDRLSRTYIPCSKVYPRTQTTEFEVFNGDTFIGYFNHLRGVWRESAGEHKRFHDSLYFPVETAINLDLRNDQNLNKLYSPTQSTQADRVKYAMQEKAGVHRYTPEDDFFQSTDLYLYNSVYSRQDDSKIYIPKPFDFDGVSNQNYDVRVTNSDKKFNGELSDSWTKFRFNNIIDVDSKYGGITALKNYGNNLFFLQPDGVGILAVEEREIQESQSVGQLTLGVGGVLGRYDYITTVDGCSDRDSIVETKTGLFFMDKKRETYNQLTDGVVQITKVLGMQPYFKDNLSIYHDIIAGYNEKENKTYISAKPIRLSVTKISTQTLSVTPPLYEAVVEVKDMSLRDLKLKDGMEIIRYNATLPIEGIIFNFNNSTNRITIHSSSNMTAIPTDDEYWILMNGFTLLFSEALNKFSEFKKFEPSNYIVTPSNFMSIDSLGTKYDGSIDIDTYSRIYIHGRGQIAKYYEKDPAISKLTIIVTPGNTTMCRFDIVEFMTEVVSGTIDQYKTFSRMRVYNSYQDTGVMNLNPGSNIKRRMRTWRMNQLRDLKSNSPRIKDYYVIIELEFDNNGTETIRVNDITTVFTPLRIH
jgi:hypothetical protein